MSEYSTTGSTSTRLRRVEAERDEAKQALAEALDRVDDAERECDAVRAELDTERDKRAEDIAAYERACGLAFVAEQERDTLLLANSFFEGVAHEALDARDLAQAELASARTELDAVRTARDNLDQLLADARAEIRQYDADLKLCPRCGREVDAEVEGTGTPALADWVVARDGGRACIRCDREIRRGEAYELMPGIDEDRHIHCPDRPEGGTDA